MLGTGRLWSKTIGQSKALFKDAIRLQALHSKSLPRLNPIQLIFPLYKTQFSQNSNSSNKKSEKKTITDKIFPRVTIKKISIFKKKQKKTANQDEKARKQYP